MTPFFLVHHAQAAGDGRYVDRLFRDLQKDVYDRLGYRESFRGAMADAQAAAPGREGRANPQALLTPVLVALYSDAYFADSQCGLEWSLFRERLRWHEHFTGRRSPALIGLRWSFRDDEPPAPIGTVPMLGGDYGGEYAAGGVLRMLRVTPASAQYRALIEDVVDVISKAQGDQPPSLSARDAALVERSGRMSWAEVPGRAWATITAGNDRPASSAGPAQPDVHRAGPLPAGGRSVAARGQWERRWRMADPDRTRRPILRRTGTREFVPGPGEPSGPQVQHPGAADGPQVAGGPQHGGEVREG